jgi:L-alanine-DL-glutamate epimerase-like enolase superfamily enzyme
MPTIEHIDVRAYEIPTDEPESDATLEWDSTTIVVVEAHAGDATGIGYTYDDVAAAALIESKLKPVVEGRDALAPPAAWAAMQKKLRNAGRPGVGAMAISAVDIALWDLKAKLLGVPLADLLPRFHESVPVYGSGGFTSYSLSRLASQLGAWVDEGIPRVKMKVGRDPDADCERLNAVRGAIGDDASLMVDANGGYTPKQAIEWAARFAEYGVTYLEEPVTSEDLEGMKLVRDRAPAAMAVAAGEYAWDLPDVEELASTGAVDIVQADVTRCGGITNMLRVDGLCKARALPFSAHCAPAVTAHVGCAMETLVHLEYFHDHVRIESMLFDGTLSPRAGRLTPDPDRPGLGLELRQGEADAFRVA